jgi:hypothetical protein
MASIGKSKPLVWQHGSSACIKGPHERTASVRSYTDQAAGFYKRKF